jgi:hypothetical protein
MKDTNHLGRDDSRHPEGDAKLLRAWRLRMVRHSVWTRGKHPVGLERPIMTRVAPAQGAVPFAAVAVKDLAALDRFAARTQRASLTAILAAGFGPL